MLLKFRGQSTDMFVCFSSIWQVFFFFFELGLDCILCGFHSQGWETCFAVFLFSNLSTISRGKNKSISLLKTRVTPNPSSICPSRNQYPWETQSKHLPRLWKADPYRQLALWVNDNIWKAAGYMRLKSKCLAALEVLRFGQASTINKGALLAIVFKSITSLQTQELCAQRGPCAVGPLHQEGTQLTQTGFILISAASGPPHRLLLSFQRSLVYKCP